MTSEEDKRWLRALPLLLSASLLLMAGGGIFLSQGQNTAATAGLTAGLLLLGAWAATAIVDWYRQRGPQKDTPDL